ncbi:putative ABC transporter permease protein [Geobacter sp. OR-1]|uniref:ABC transporter permease n=1 Tax=Geobacter sp. OR-1 TaxID=1266765 RepID=UPI0005430E0D|nr:ABC transporter permease [Geobacter sp. OR-1]GAM10281.1 putative ABC transporter permease protein [Geobacter sp. OR-1]
MSEELVAASQAGLKTPTVDSGSYIKRFEHLFEGLNKWSQGIPLVLAFFAVWEALPRLGLIDPLFLPAFSTTIKTLFDLTVSGKLLLHVLVSLQRSLIGFGLAVLIAVPLGFLMGWYSRFERYTDLLMQSLRNTSTFALLPIFLLLLGLGEASKIAIIFYGASWQLLMNTITGVKSVDPIYIKAAKSMGVSDRDLFRKIILPASIPSIVVGARMGAKIALMVVIAAEMIGAKTGLGFFIQNAQFNFMIPEMYAGILTLAILGLTINYLLVWFEKKATYWKGEFGSGVIG